MAVDNELEIVVSQHAEESDVRLLHIIRQSVARSGIGVVPVVGSSINNIFSGLAQRRAAERMNSVFRAMKKRLDELGEEKINKSFFETEEFQTVLLLILENIHTTHDAEKLKVFGNALANAGAVDLKNADKENLARILRDLTATDFVVLNDDMLKGWTPHLHTIEYPPDVMTSSTSLHPSRSTPIAT